MALDLILRNARIGGREPETPDIGIAGGRFVEIAPGIKADAPEEDISGKLVVAGFVETHIHLDKSCILPGTGRLRRRSPKLRPPNGCSARTTSIGLQPARWRRRSCKARCACAPMSRSIRE
jgi:hypothetical protein